MQTFLEEVKSRNINLGGPQSESQIDPAKIRSWIGTLIRGIHHYRDSSQTIDGQTLGIIKFTETSYPNFTNLVKAHRVQFTKEQMNQAFTLLIGQLKFQTEYLSKQMLYNIFFLCGIERGDTVPEAELVSSYWFPMSDAVKLNINGQRLVNLKPCTSIGGSFGRQKTR